MEKFEEAYKKSFEVDGGSIVRNSIFGSFGGGDLKQWTFKEEMVEKLRMIEDDWDWIGGKKPSETAIAEAEKVLDLFGEEKNRKCAVFPSSDGGVYVQYKDGEVRVNVFIREDGNTVWFLRNGSEKKVWVKSTNEMKDILFEFFEN